MQIKNNIICIDTIINNFISINKNKFKINKEDNESFSILINIPLSQSEKIQLGIRMENMLSLFIIKNTLLKNIKEKNNKGNKVTDHLFMDNDNKIIYYAELKANLNLDTEKSIKTVQKCLNIKNLLIKKYPNYKINMFLVSLRHLTSSTIKKEIKNKYKEIFNNLIGINEYLIILGIPQQDEFKNEKNYKIFVNKFVNMLKSHN